MQVIGTIRDNRNKIKIKLNAEEKEIKRIFRKVYFIGYINNTLVKHNKTGWWIKSSTAWKKMSPAYWRGLRMFW